MHMLGCPCVQRRILASQTGRHTTLPDASKRAHRRVTRHTICARTDENASKPAKAARNLPEPGLGLKAVWYGAEQFGNIIGFKKKRNKSPTTVEPMTREQVIASIREDYDQTYFFTGSADMEAYEPDCVFADPFTSFRGVERFRKNVSNLGGLLHDIKLDIYHWHETDEQLETKWRVSGVVQLPWKPLLAAAGGTTHVFSQDSGRVSKHIESWDVEPSKVLKRLLKPTARTPSTRWEKGMLALHDGNAAGFLLQALLPLAQLVGILLAISLLLKALK